MILLTMFRSSEILENHVKTHLAIDHTKVVTLSEKTMHMLDSSIFNNY